MGMNNIKNKIITLSGEPVSGKGTAVKNLIKKLGKQSNMMDNFLCCKLLFT